MKKIVVFLGIMVLCHACKLASAISNQTVMAKQGSFSFNPEEMIVVPIELDSLTGVPFLFDTGASISFIKNDSILSKTAKNGAITFGHVTTADGERHRKKLVIAKMNTPWFGSGNKILGLHPSPVIECPGKQTLNGLIGVDTFLQSNMVLSINNTMGEITSYPSGEFDLDSLQGYTKVKAVIDKKGIWIELKIYGIPAMYLLDTGNNSGIISPFHNAVTYCTAPLVILGESFESANRHFGKETIITETAVSIGSIVFEGPVILRKGNQMKNLGMSAIKLFDWFIDFSSRQVYIKRNMRKSTGPKILKPYFTSIRGGTIEVISKIKGFDEYEIGDKIIAVANKTVTNENICQIQELLNSSQNWQDLSIKIRR